MERVIVVFCVVVHLTLGSSRNVDVLEGGVCNETNGKKWYCKTLGDCPYPQKDLEDESKEPPFCKFDRHQREPVVCCHPNLSGGKSERMCKRFSEGVKNCTVNEIKETTAPPQLYPHIASIGFGNASSISWLCVGSLVSDRFILSVAQCNQREKPIWVKLGDYDRDSDNDEKKGLSQPMVYEVLEVITHPDFKPIVFYNNLALLKLNESVRFNNFIRPICLHTEYDLFSPFVIGTGYGRKDVGAKWNTVLQQVNMTLVPATKCNEDYNIYPDVLENGVTDESIICTDEPISEHHVCSLEPGSPLQQRSKHNSCMFNLVGVRVFTARCTGVVPGLYTRVSHFLPWIESVLWP